MATENKDSPDGLFWDRYPWIRDAARKVKRAQGVIWIKELGSPLGPMLAASSEKGICMLEFVNRIRFEAEILSLQKLLGAVMHPGTNSHLEMLESELKQYFLGNLKGFSVPLDIPGTDFSLSVWTFLKTVPYGSRLSYKRQSEMMGQPKAIRAIASTNGRNRIAIVIPCHRIIGHNGSMTGYAGGIDKKMWLLKFEQANSEKAGDCLF